MIKSIELLKLLETIQKDERDTNLDLLLIDKNEHVKFMESLHSSGLWDIYIFQGWFSITKQPPELQTWIMNYLWERCEEILGGDKC